MVRLPSPEHFQWDKGNKEKNWKRHNVTVNEAESLFLDPLKIVLKDRLHSAEEPRYIVIGMTSSNRLLTIIFTIRNNMVRVISARDAAKKERKIYEEKTGITKI